MLVCMHVPVCVCMYVLLFRLLFLMVPTVYFSLKIQAVWSQRVLNHALSKRPIGICSI